MVLHSKNRPKLYLELADAPGNTLELGILCLVLLWLVGILRRPRWSGNLIHVLLVMVVALVVVRFPQAPAPTA